MPVKVRIPAVLRPQVGGQSSVEASPGTLRDVVAELVGAYPSLADQLLGEEGQLHRFVNVYINDEDIRYLDGLDTKLGEGDVLSILPAVAGGSG
jgi:molybdopterin synthase sulfur carrier subunit